MKMKIVISKVLEGAMAQALFDASQVKQQCWLKDCLMLQILRAENSKGYRTLTELLEDWQLKQLKLRLERFAYRLGVGSTTPEEFYRGYASHLTELFASEQQITTKHAVIEILGDRATLSSKLFAIYNVTAERIGS